ncbi:serine/threonine-protein kinase [Candidatus Magnetominusculus xianensis]|uniref:Serine/threonine-protein kinase PknB n=1 Tax=Candidatus Magnetominusculus xianensis TaxID=1748249 RepID=A0ABR5SJ18_9BACT|nr:serine/threonine-protein kinase [Candidatus Magnetominusculus xianensis]KWT91872.1 serine/threonine-protein kinase PknB [Candidatus Magnetominusculus xianensis]MBF0404064.1 protein kinase [Nitrospirota bacterium]
MIAKMGRYEILNVLGEGAMGVVYRGHDTIIDRIVAIKTVKMENVESPQKKNELIGHFYHEARIAGKLSHPNIAHIYDVGQDNAGHYLVMEYVEGITLKTAISENPDIPLLEKLRILIDIGRTLHYAHQRGVVHRDIKPANIMLLKNSHIKIMDFGIAMLASSGEGQAAQGGLMGTPAYLSPEQIDGTGLDRQTDIFSLGVLSYEFLSGKKPFIADTIHELMDKILHTEPQMPHIVNPHLDEPLSRLILKALEKNKERRCQSASEFADLLDLYAGKMDMERTQNITAIKNYDKTVLADTLKKKYTFFSDFTTEELLKIISISSYKTFKKDTCIFNEGDIGTKMYIVISGKVRITKVFKENEEETLLAVLKSGECFGEMAVMDASPRFAAAKAETDCVTIAISEVILRNSEPMLCLKLYKNLAAVLSEKLRNSDIKINELYNRLKQCGAT